MIEERLQEANIRSEIKYYKSDTRVKKDHKETIMTYVYRKTRFLITELIKDRKTKIFDNPTLKNFKRLLLITEKNFQDLKN